MPTVTYWIVTRITPRNIKNQDDGVLLDGIPLEEAMADDEEFWSFDDSIPLDYNKFWTMDDDVLLKNGFSWSNNNVPINRIAVEDDKDYNTKITPPKTVTINFAHEVTDMIVVTGITPRNSAKKTTGFPYK